MSAVWVSTFGLYNAGLLVGRWYELDAEEAPETVEDWLADVRVNGTKWEVSMLDKHADEIGEELWCFDVEGLISAGELSPMEANEEARRLNDLESDTGIPRPVLIDLLREGWTDEDIEAGYSGEWRSLKEFAMQTAEDLGMVDNSWPYNCIDWDHATRELAMDYHVVEYGPRVYVFHY